MVGLSARSSLCWTVGILWGLHAQAGMAQIFARVTAVEAAAATNSACGLRACPPKALTYGYYHEHWRRWPEEPSGPLAGDMSPFAVPDRSKLTGEAPDARDEASQVPRQRKPVPATPEDADAPPPGQAPAAPSGTGQTPPPSAVPDAAKLPEPQPVPPSGAMPTPPPPDPQDVNGLPDVPTIPGATPPATPGTSDGNLDLDSLDFQGSQSDSMPPLTSAAALEQKLAGGAQVAPASHLEAVPAESPIADASAASGEHRNPLRPKVKARYASSRSTRPPATTHPAERPATPVGPHSQSRANPLRRG